MRGCTYSTLLRTHLVKDWNPPSYVCAYEDHLLLRHVVKKGYVWKIVLDLAVKHHGFYSLKTSLKKARWNMAGARLIEFNKVSLLTLAKNLMKNMIKSLFASMEIGEPMIIPYVFITQLGYIQGWMEWCKYVVMRR